jgi:hypothetical protein
VKNLNRNRSRLRRLARVSKSTYHDLRRSCLTNWANHLPIHVVQRLAGHSEIRTTQQYYLAVREDDLAKARETQETILAGSATAPKVTHTIAKGRRPLPDRTRLQPISWTARSARTRASAA